MIRCVILRARVIFGVDANALKEDQTGGTETATHTHTMAVKRKKRNKR